MSALPERCSRPALSVQAAELVAWIEMRDDVDSLSASVAVKMMVVVVRCQISTGLGWSMHASTAALSDGRGVAQVAL